MESRGVWSIVTHMLASDQVAFHLRVAFFGRSVGPLRPFPSFPCSSSHFFPLVDVDRSSRHSRRWPLLYALPIDVRAANSWLESFRVRSRTFPAYEIRPSCFKSPEHWQQQRPANREMWSERTVKSLPDDKGKAVDHELAGEAISGAAECNKCSDASWSNTQRNEIPAGLAN